MSAALLQETLDREPVGEGRQQHWAQNGSSHGGVLSDDAESSNSMGTDVLITHGDADDVVPVALVQRCDGDVGCGAAAAAAAAAAAWTVCCLTVRVQVLTAPPCSMKPSPHPALHSS